MNKKIEIPFVKFDCEKSGSPSRISKVVYNYCYDDDAVSLKINPEVNRVAEANLKNQMMLRLKKEIKSRNSYGVGKGNSNSRKKIGSP